MAPRPEAPGTVQLDCLMSGPLNQKAHCFLHASAEGATYVNSDLLALANAVRAAWITSNYMSHVATGWAFVSVTATDLNPGAAGLAVSAGSPVVGTDTGATLPPNCAICVSWKTSQRYRGGHFRSYLPGFTENALTVQGGSALTSTVVSALELWGPNMITAIGAVTIGGSSTHWQMVGITRVRTMGTPPVKTVLNPPETPLILAAVVDGRLDSQRRRLGKAPS